MTPYRAAPKRPIERAPITPPAMVRPWPWPFVFLLAIVAWALLHVSR